MFWLSAFTTAESLFYLSRSCFLWHAAAAALVLSIGTGTAYALPYGTVSLDADAAIEYTINRFDRVLSVRALNEEGETGRFCPYP